MNQLDMNWLGGDWRELYRWGTEELAAKRAELERPTTTTDQTQVLRGEIKMLKVLLAQPDTAAQAGMEPNRY